MLPQSVCVWGCVCEEILGGLNPAPKHWGKSLPLSVLPFCCLPQFPFHHPCTGLITPSVGNITGSRDGGGRSCPGGCKVPPVSLVPPAGVGRVAQQPGEILCSHSELKTRAAAASDPGLGAHPHPRAACPRLWAGFWGAQAGTGGSCSRAVLLPASHPCTEQERERAGGKGRVKSIIFKQKPLRPKGPFKSCLFN